MLVCLDDPLARLSGCMSHNLSLIRIFKPMPQEAAKYMVCGQRVTKGRSRRVNEGQSQGSRPRSRAKVKASTRVEAEI